MFENTEFKSVVTNSRGSTSNRPVFITHNKGKNKEEQTYKISSEAMNKCGFNYKDKVDIQFSPDFKICRIIKQDSGLTLSRQTANNPQSSAVTRMLFKSGIHPDLLNIAFEQSGTKKDKVMFENGEIEYKEGVLTFELKLI
jgi:nucleoside-specific outer membrane channel protein Tsx